MLMFRHLKGLTPEHSIFVIAEDSSKTRHLNILQKNFLTTDTSKNLLRRVLFKLRAERLWFLLRAKEIERKISAKVREIKPDVILTVWHGPHLFSAVSISKKRRIPLVVLVHDDWEKMLPDRGWGRETLYRELRQIYHNAKEVGFISTQLGEEFQRRYGTRSWETILPIPEEQSFDPASSGRPQEPLRIGYFGDLLGNIKVLEKVSEVLERCGARLTFFSHGESPERQALRGRRHVRDAGHADIRDLAEFFTGNIDVTLIAQSFMARHENLVRTCFPSKLPEACQFGLPLCVVAPSYGSATSWAKENLPSFCLCTDLEKNRIAECIQQLKGKKRWAQAQQAVLTGRKDFSPKRIQDQLEKLLDKAVKNSR